MKTYIISGFTGSGKSEFVVNFALNLRNEFANERVTIADLDVINPYFRSREREKHLNSVGIEVYGGALGNDTGQDVPHLNYGFTSRIGAEECVIVDLAGGVLGVNALANVYSFLKDYEFWGVLNAYRPETYTAEKMLTFIEQLQERSRIQLTGLVNNSHMLWDTTAEHILSSQEIIVEVSKATNLPLKYTMLARPIYEQIAGRIASEKVLLFDTLQLRETWQ